MFKQILSKIPRKSSKSLENRGHKNVSGAGTKASRKSDVGSNRSSNQHNLGANGAASSRGQNKGKKLVKSIDSMKNGVTLYSYEALPSSRDVPSSEKQSLFLRKLHMCCVFYNFHDPTKNLREKEIKKLTLLELVDYISLASGKFQENVMQEIIKMVYVNLFWYQIQWVFGICA